MYFMHAKVSLYNGNGFGKNVLIFGADTTSSVHIDSKKKEVSLTKHLSKRWYIFGN